MLRLGADRRPARLSRPATWPAVQRSATRRRATGRAPADRTGAAVPRGHPTRRQRGPRYGRPAPIVDPTRPLGGNGLTPMLGSQRRRSRHQRRCVRRLTTGRDTAFGRAVRRPRQSARSATWLRPPATMRRSRRHPSRDIAAQGLNNVQITHSVAFQRHIQQRAGCRKSVAAPAVECGGHVESAAAAACRSAWRR